MGFGSLVVHAWQAYFRNIKLISFFSIPFLICFPLVLAMPNFTALGGIFLRFASVQRELGIVDGALILAALAVSLLLFSFAIVAVNLLIKSQRVLLSLTSRDLEAVETGTFKLFWVYAIVFAFVLAINYALYDYGLHSTLGALVSFIAAAAVFFVPQAIVIENIELRHVVERSVSIALRRLPYFVGLLAIAALLLLVNTWIFLQIGSSMGENALYARYAAIVVNALFVLPFMECLKTQVFLSKYTILD
ncbi:TPA: hypothetical protein HA318_05670 [Candidatus Micrarchaeota archaeon]|nr:MAG: hypothetical protein AUJ65_01445 [Candidatus Micrarchaeota archaeon CG1_02_51_15]HII39459.1 hypothetical protein [Candidatus Micrarchaeota archaeon]